MTDKSVVLSVSDNGCGMDEATQPKVFDAFFTTKPGSKGTGLGLAMAHDIVTAHGGTIGLKSKPAEGTTFTLTFPKADEVDLPASTPVELQRYRASKKCQAIIVDDEREITDVLKTMLEDCGIEVFAFADARSALQAYKAAAQNIDLIITDIKMQEMSGIELLKAVRATPDTKQPRIVLATGGVAEIGADGEIQQADHLLHKPFQTDEFHKMLFKLFPESGKSEPEKSDKDVA